MRSVKLHLQYAKNSAFLTRRIPFGKTETQNREDYFNVSIEYLTGESTERTTKRTKEPSGSNTISISLSDLEFALFRGIQSLSDFEKQDLLDYLQFKKEQKERRNNQN